jgi:hypothetical protein
VIVTPQEYRSMTRRRFRANRLDLVGIRGLNDLGLSDAWDDWQNEKGLILVMGENGRINEALRKLDEAQTYFGKKLRDEGSPRWSEWARDLVEVRRYVREELSKGAEARLAETLAREKAQENANLDPEQRKRDARTMRLEACRLARIKAHGSNGLMVALGVDDTLCELEEATGIPAWGAIALGIAGAGLLGGFAGRLIR